jgi:hypothetical protein
MLVRIDADGFVTYYPRAVATTQETEDALGIATGPDGAIWLTQYGGTIVRAGLPSPHSRP